MHKYRAKKKEYNGDVYDSTAEADFAAYLDLLRIEYERQPIITLQESFKDQHGTCRAIEYQPDFKIGRFYIDVKGVSTPDFALKAKMMRHNSRYLECEYRGSTLILAKRKGKRWILWEWEEPRKNTKRTPFDIAKLKESDR